MTCNFCDIGQLDNSGFCNRCKTQHAIMRGGEPQPLRPYEELKRAGADKRAELFERVHARLHQIVRESNEDL